jgi:hypothetical protein
MRADLPVRVADHRFLCLPYLFPFSVFPQVEVSLEQQSQQFTALEPDKVLGLVMGQAGRLRAGQLASQAVEGPHRDGEWIDGIEGVIRLHTALLSAASVWCDTSEVREKGLVAEAVMVAAALRACGGVTHGWKAMKAIVEDE